MSCLPLHCLVFWLSHPRSPWRFLHRGSVRLAGRANLGSIELCLETAVVTSEARDGVILQALYASASDIRFGTEQGLRFSCLWISWAVGSQRNRNKDSTLIQSSFFSCVGDLCCIAKVQEFAGVPRLVQARQPRPIGLCPSLSLYNPQIRSWSILSFLADSSFLLISTSLMFNLEAVAHLPLRFH